MAFFNPALLWFMIGGSIPIIIHLLHRQKYRRVRWAAMEFLLAALKKTRRRLQLENFLLLLVRVLIMIVLALALARPFFRESPIDIMADSDTHHVFVIDNSYSMGYKKAQRSSLDDAKKSAEDKLLSLRKLSEQDRISVLLMSNYPEVWVAESNKIKTVLEQIGQIKLSHFGTSMYVTLQKVKEVIDKSRKQQSLVYIFTDFQRISWVPDDETEQKRFAELTRALSARDNVRFLFVDVGSKDAENRAIVDLRVENPVVTVKMPARFTVALHNWSAASYPAVAVNFFVDGSLHKTESVTLPANSSMTASFQNDFVEPGAHTVEVSTEPDFLDLDDRRTLALEVKDGISGILVDGEPGNRPWSSETDYLRIVLDSAELFKLEGQVTPEMFDAENLEKRDFVALCNVQSLSQEKVEKLERFVRGGGGLLIALGGKVDKGWYNEALWKEGKGLLPAALVELGGSPPEQDPPVPVRIQDYRNAHRIFSTFRKGLEAQPRQLIFYRYYRLEKYDAASVIAEFDDNFSTPLWIEKPFGDGRVLLYNNTADEGWNLQVPGRIPYVVMMLSACEHLGARPAARRNLFIGDFIAMQMTADRFQRQFVLDTPGEGQVTISPEAPRGESPTFWVKYPTPPPERREGEPKPTENEGLRFAGRYTLDKLTRREDERPIAYFAVNLPPRVPSPEELNRAEGNLDRILDEEIRRRLPDFKFEIIGRKGASQEVALTPPAAGLWKHLLYMLIALLGTESVLAWIFGKAKQ